MGDDGAVDGLNKITGCENPDRTMDVIFVHGLDGDALSTWRAEGKEENFWPRWLGDDFPDVGVWSLGYAVSSSAWKGNSMPLADRATNTLDQLELDGIGHRAVIFICHSLGGLLVKQMLRHAHDFGNPDYRRIADQTRGIVFLSTPHSGSNIANWIKHLGTLLRTTVSVDELEAHHPRLRELNTWFRNHPKTPQIKTLVYCEKIKLKGLLVVDETSADPGIPGVVPVPMDDDHTTICKPKNRNSQIYKRVRKLLDGVVAASCDGHDDLSQTKNGNAINKFPDDSPLPESFSARSGHKRFKIALSFPGEHRPFVEKVAECLATEVGREQVLYDKYFEAEFAQPDLDTHLQALYHEQSEMIAVFLCADYERKDWCGVEWRAIRDLIKRREGASVMPLRFDDTEIPWLFSIDGYVWIGDRSPQEIGNLILQRSRGKFEPIRNHVSNSHEEKEESSTADKNDTDPARLEQHLQFQNQIRAKIEEELAKETLKPLREGFIEILSKNAGKDAIRTVPELVNELFKVDKATGRAVPEAMLNTLRRATEVCLERLEAVGERITETDIIWKTAKQILGWLTTLAVRSEKLSDGDEDGVFDEIDLETLIGVEIYAARKKEIAATFRADEIGNSSESFQGGNQIDPGFFPETGWQVQDIVNQIRLIVWKAVYKKEPTTALTEVELEKLNATLELHRTRHRDSVNYHLAIRKSSNHPLLIPEICKQVKVNLPELTIVHMGAEADSGPLLLIGEGKLTALIEEFLTLIGRYQ